LIRKLFIPFILLAGILFSTCAKIGTPFGGPKDETPPVVMKTTPPDKSTDFIPQKKIVITFDEYIQLENIFQEMIVSPPLDGNVMAQLKGKSIDIEFPKEAVFDTTTYTLSFGNSIKDNNEGNLLKNYEYVFSLKDYLDTMNIEGKILNAFNHQPDKDRMYVMLYKNLADSAPLLEKPRYVCRSDEAGNFTINNLESGTYRAFGLKDANLNLRFDLPNEQIAFSDSLIKLSPELLKNIVQAKDSLQIPEISPVDSVVTDSASVDSVKSSERKYMFHTELYFFTQEVKNQYMTNYLRPRPDQLFFSFFQSLEDSLDLMPVNFSPARTSWYLLDENKSKDTLYYWLTDTAMVSKDSIQMQVCYPVYDSSGSAYYLTDTLLLMAQKEKSTSIRGRKERNKSENEKDQKKKVEPLILKNNIKNSGAFDLDKKIVITSPTPVKNVLIERIELYRQQDTLEYPVKFQLEKDTSSFYRYFIYYNPEELTSYRLLIRDSTFFDIYGVTQDTTEIRFKTQAEDYYGSMTLHMQRVIMPIILQLLDEKENVLKEARINSDQDIRFGYLYPVKYLLKVIYDTNGNGKWDTGNYLLHLQPEKVIYYKQPAEVRSNWEMDFTWELE
jgi:hypothetical protein